MWKTTKVILCHNFPPTPGKKWSAVFSANEEMENHEKTIKNNQNSWKQICCSRKIFQQLKLTVWLKFLRQSESSISQFLTSNAIVTLSTVTEDVFGFKVKFLIYLFLIFLYPCLVLIKNLIFEQFAARGNKNTAVFPFCISP